MKAVSLKDFAAEAFYASSGKRNKFGSIENPGYFEQNLAAIESQHDGIFAFFAFHPRLDKHIAEYLLDSDVGSDAGAHILALCLAAPGTALSNGRPNGPVLEYGVKLSTEQHPAYRLASRFYPAGYTPAFPGIVIFDSLAGPKLGVYVPLLQKDAKSLLVECRGIFAIANKALLGANSSERGLAFDRLSAGLIEAGVQQSRSWSIGFRGGALISRAWVKRNAGSILVAIPSLLGGLGKLKAPSSRGSSPVDQ
jgi:hypothetical protein